MTGNRRKRSRVELHFPLTVCVRGEDVDGVVQDLSLKGVSCATEKILPVGEDCAVTLTLDSGVRINISGRVVRSGPESAIDFTGMNETSFTHLRNLVRLYAEDADAVDHELSTPAFAPSEENESTGN